MARKAREIVDLIKEQNIKMVDLKFIDVPGTWQHTTIPADQMDEGALQDGIGFDGSSIRGFQSIHESDMILKPDPESAQFDTFRSVPTLSMICDVWDPMAKSYYDRDPRNIAKRAEAYLQKTGIADTSFFGPEAEFFILDNVVYENGSNRAGFEIDSVVKRIGTAETSTVRTSDTRSVRRKATFRYRLPINMPTCGPRCR